MPPYGYLLELHVVVVLRTIILFHYGSVNTRASASFMDTAGLYVILCLIFFSRGMRPPPPHSLADPPFIGARHPYTRLALIQPMARGARTADARCG